MDFRLTAEEEALRQVVERFVREELIPLEAEFAGAPDIFEGSRWKSRVKTSEDPEIKRYLGLMQELEHKAAAAGPGISMCRKPMAARKSATSR